MDSGLTIKNPYASVSLPRGQLRDGFLTYHLGNDLTSDTTLVRPSALPTYSAAPEEVAEVPRLPCLAWNGHNAQVQEGSQARPTNPYASFKMPRADAPEPFRWKSHEEAAQDPSSSSSGCSSCCSPCCPKCGPCRRKCWCVVS